MARPTLFSHPKWAKLVARLKNRALALGSLELIWEAAYASGDPIIGDVEAVEELADWRGPRGELASAMVHAGFLDVHPAADGGQVHVVHDLEDHAPDYVIKRWQREADRRKQGKTLREVRQEAARARWAGGQVHGAVHDASVLPPAPAPTTDRDLPGMQTDANGGQVHKPDPWEAFDAKYPDLKKPPKVDERYWSSGTWRQNYGRHWAKVKNRLTYGMASDGVACSKLTDVLEGMAHEERLQAESNAEAMFEAFMADTYPPLIKAQHPFAWFVQRFGALLVDVETPAAPAEPPPPQLRRIRDDDLAPVGTSSEARRQAAARLAQPRAEPARAPARAEVTPPSAGPVRAS